MRLTTAATKRVNREAFGLRVRSSPKETVMSNAVLSTTPDFHVQHHLSVALLRPETVAARDWCRESLMIEDALTWANAYVVEPRYLEEILKAIVDGGLTVKLGG
jgi:hypothetical protein